MLGSPEPAGPWRASERQASHSLAGHRDTGDAGRLCGEPPQPTAACGILALTS